MASTYRQMRPAYADAVPLVSENGTDTTSTLLKNTDTFGTRNKLITPIRVAVILHFVLFLSAFACTLGLALSGNGRLWTRLRMTILGQEELTRVWDEGTAMFSSCFGWAAFVYGCLVASMFWSKKEYVSPKDRPSYDFIGQYIDQLHLNGFDGIRYFMTAADACLFWVLLDIAHNDQLPSLLPYTTSHIFAVALYCGCEAYAFRAKRLLQGGAKPEEQGFGGKIAFIGTFLFDASNWAMIIYQYHQGAGHAPELTAMVYLWFSFHVLNIFYTGVTCFGMRDGHIASWLHLNGIISMIRQYLFLAQSAIFVGVVWGMDILKHKNDVAA